jgi:CRP-like cAMP-binding protein
VREIIEHCPADMPQRTVAAGVEVMTDGLRAGVLLILIDGSVEIVKRDYRINVISEPGAVFGEISALLDSPHSATVRTLTESRFFVAEDPLGFLHSQPRIALAVSKLLAKRLHAMTSYLIDLKQQFEESGDHFGMIDEVLDTLTHTQGDDHEPGSERDPDPTVY